MSGHPTTPSSSALYLRLLGHVRPYAKTFAVGIFFMIVLALSEVALPALLKPMLDGTFVEKDQAYLTWAPIGLVVLFTVRAAAAFIHQIAFADISTRVVFDLRRDMFDQLLVLPTTYYDSQATGNIVSKVTYDVTQVMKASVRVLTVLVKDSITVIGLIVYIFWLDWQLALFIFVLIPVIALVATVIGRRLRKVNRMLQSAQGDMTHILEESLRGNKTVKVFGGQTYEKNRFDEMANWMRRVHMKLFVADGVGVPIVELIGAVVMAMVMYIGTSRTEADQLSVGGFVALFTALGLLIAPIKRLTKVNEPLQRGLAAAETVFGLIDEEGERDRGTAEWPKPAGHIRIEGLSFTYPEADTPALADIDLDIRAGTTVALVGASGSGKSTLVNLIPRLYNPTSGRVLIDGIDTQELPLRTLRGHIALVSQDILLFNDTVAANIAYGMETLPADDVLREIARAAHAEEFIEQLPDGFETLVGENGVRLSGGQRQRLAIARALLKDQQILILDEATSALDNESERHVQAALENLRRGRTTLVIAHRLTTIEHADRILVMDQGRIVEDGDHETLLALDGRYAMLYRRNFEPLPEPETDRPEATDSRNADPTASTDR